jgi:ubiquinone/menaquinone biosynthesis C-methylase UbiE
VTSVYDELVEAYPAWWVDLLGEQNHVGGQDSTAWLFARARLNPGDRALDAGAFVGGTARFLAANGIRAVALDLGRDFLVAGHKMDNGDSVDWVAGVTQRLPFADGAFRSAWCMDSYIAPRELTRVVASGGTVCLCCEVPVDSRGGVEAFMDEWVDLGFELVGHRQLSLEATQAWRAAEAELVRRRQRFQERYGDRGYVAQLDMVTDLVQAYERGELGHGLFVFTKE